MFLDFGYKTIKEFEGSIALLELVEKHSKKYVIKWYGCGINFLELPRKIHYTQQEYEKIAEHEIKVLQDFTLNGFKGLPILNEVIIHHPSHNKDRKSYFIIMPYYGEELSHKLNIIDDKKRAPLAYEVGINIAHSLQSALKLGYVHGDIHPANIALGENHCITLLDWELSMLLGKCYSGKLREGEWFAPETKKKSSFKAKPSSDIYSLGYCMRKIIDSQEPKELIRIINKCMDTNPRKRYNKYSHLIEDLYNFSNPQGVSTK